MDYYGIINILPETKQQYYCLLQQLFGVIYHTGNNLKTVRQNMLKSHNFLFDFKYPSSPHIQPTLYALWVMLSNASTVLLSTNSPSTMLLLTA